MNLNIISKLILFFSLSFIIILNELLIKLNNNPKNSLNILKKQCYITFENNGAKIIHLIITRFMIEFYEWNGFPKNLYNRNYINNGIRVMKKYLLPSLDSQSCKNFIWILMIGEKINKTKVESLINFHYSFEYKILYQKSVDDFIKKITENYDVLITTRIDYDDQIYYDAVNDVRKAINIDKPMILFGYNRGVYYYEYNKKYYEFERTFKNDGVMSIFASLITTLKKVNDTYTIYSLGDHTVFRKTLLNQYKSYGIKTLDYEPSIFDSGTPKFIYVRQKFSGSNTDYYYIPEHLKEVKINLSNFFGKF